MYSQPSASAGFTSATGSNICGGGGGGGGSSRKFPQTKLEFAALATIYIAFTLYLQLFT